ncbi:hypothetical protein L1049_008150 [Liquidambar formosana]|uniref:Cyclin-like domain-containing protein n=1 Tax=Liquidambar formosana TaxID=63359 RepID=A0AAP0X835_LIQFO
MTRADCEQAFGVCIQKELHYMPQPGYVKLLQSYDLIIARLRVVHWLIRSRSRLNLSFGTVFMAANYLDRFISMNQCRGWKYWMVELLSVACLSVASKFNETSTPPLHEIQMEDLDHSFQSNTIQQMELMLLQALEWRLGSTTAYSYVELLIWNIESLKPHLHEEVTTRVTELLLGALLDSKLLEFRPCVIAVSALRCGLEELVPSTCAAHLTYNARLIPEDQKDDLVQCHKIMEAGMVDPLYNLIARGHSHYCPSSPVTVLLTERIDIYDFHVDLSLFKMPAGSNADLESRRKKRKRDE